MALSLKIKHVIALLIMLSLMTLCCSMGWCAGTASATPAATESKAPDAKVSEAPAGTPGTATHAATPAASNGKSPSGAPSTEPTAKPTAKPTTKGSPSTEPSGTPSQEASAPPAATASATESATETPGETVILGIDVKKYMIHIIAGIGGLIIIFIIVMLLMGKKQKHVCEKCGKPVLPGMVYCEECTDQKASRPEEKQAPITSPPVREPVRPVNGPAVMEPVAKKKQRPSGRVIATITVRRGANQGYKFNFYETVNQITLGSDPDCDMVVEEDEEVSARHGVISMSEKDGFQIHDMGNTSGLYINNERVKQSGLKSGDVIRMGKTEFTFARL
jgi:hypothetical protein